MTMHFMEKPPDFFDIVKFIIVSFPLFRNGFLAKNRPKVIFEMKNKYENSPSQEFSVLKYELQKNPDKISAGNRRLFYGQISFFQVYCSQEQQILHFVMSVISNSDFC